MQVKKSLGLVVWMLLEITTARGEIPETVRQAVITDDIKSLEILVHNGTSLDEVDEAKTTLLHLAARSGALQVATFLLRSGIPVNVLDDELFTPLMRACSRKDDQMVQLLVEAGALPWSYNSFGETAPLLALQADCDVCLKAIFTAIKKVPDHQRKTILQEISNYLLAANNKNNKNIGQILGDFWQRINTSQKTANKPDSIAKKKNTHGK
jgi:ankyrin repeat protein